MDLSQAQIELAAATLRARDHDARLFQSPMEVNPGLPEGYFDLVISIYALGWTTDLNRTLSLVALYLKPGGRFVFSWEHPLYSCMAYEEGRLTLVHSYSEEGPIQRNSWQGVPIVMQRRKLSTFINGLVLAGLTVERLIEGDLNPDLVRDKDHDPGKWYSVPRARLMPTTFIIKTRKSA